MGVNSSSEKRCNTQNYSSLYETPPKIRALERADRFARLQFDPRSPTGGITRTPIQTNTQLPVTPLKLYNHVMPNIVGPDFVIDLVESDQENQLSHQRDNLPLIDKVIKRTSVIEPTLDPSEVLPMLIAKDDGRISSLHEL